MLNTKNHNKAIEKLLIYNKSKIEGYVRNINKIKKTMLLLLSRVK